MMYDDGYDTDDTDELLAAKCSFQPTVVVSSSSKLQQKSSGPAASTSGPAEACTIVEDEDWLFSISASSSRPSSAGTQPISRTRQQQGHISPQEAQARVELSREVPRNGYSALPCAGSSQVAGSCRSPTLEKNVPEK